MSSGFTIFGVAYYLELYKGMNQEEPCKYGKVMFKQTRKQDCIKLSVGTQIGHKTFLNLRSYNN